MKMAKATSDDFDVVHNLGFLDSVDDGYYPPTIDDDEEEIRFDSYSKEDLRNFYEKVMGAYRAQGGKRIEVKND